MRYNIDAEFRDRNPALSPEERSDLRDKIKSEGCLPGSIKLGRINGELYLVDGHTTHTICEEENVKECEPVIHDFADRAEALEWIDRHQVARRNLTDEDKKEKRDRLARIVAARTSGKSTRAIAKEEKISETQVRRDLEVSGAPPPAHVTGTDQKQYPATSTILCDRCKRTGPAKDCPKCAELRKPRRESDAKSKPKAEQQPKGQGAAAPAPIKGVCPTCGRAWKGNSFIKPTLEQITAYCTERKNKIDPQAFIDYYDSVGWKIGGKTQMRDFRAAVRNWERMAKQRSNKGKLFAGPKAFAEGK